MVTLRYRDHHSIRSATSRGILGQKEHPRKTWNALYYERFPGAARRKGNWKSVARRAPCQFRREMRWNNVRNLASCWVSSAKMTQSKQAVVVNKQQHLAGTCKIWQVQWNCRSIDQVCGGKVLKLHDGKLGYSSQKLIFFEESFVHGKFLHLN